MTGVCLLLRLICVRLALFLDAPPSDAVFFVLRGVTRNRLDEVAGQSGVYRILKPERNGDEVRPEARMTL
jgi:hypothetical protein